MTQETSTLGLSVDSSPVKRATTDLKDLASAAGSAEKGMNSLSDAATKSGQSFAVIQAMAKRAWVSFDEMDTRIAKASETARKGAAAIQAAGAPAVTAGLSLTAQRLLSSYNLVSIALQGITAASSAYIALTSNNGPKIEESLSEQARLVGLIKDAYRDATDKAGTFFESSKAILKLQTELNINNLQNNIREQVADALKSAVGVTSNVDILGNSIGTGFIDIGPKLQPFKAAINDLMESVGQGGPAIERFRDAVAGIGNADPALRDVAGELLKATQAAGDTADKILAAQSALRLINKTATPEDRARLGLSNRIPTGRDPFDAQVTSVNKHIAAMKADALAVDATAGEHARLRIEAQLLEAAQRNGGDATEAQKRRIAELGQTASDAATALARANVASEIKFGQSTMFLTQDDVQIARQLKSLYPDVADALGSVEANALRSQMAVSQLSQTSLTPINGELISIPTGEAA